MRHKILYGIMISGILAAGAVSCVNSVEDYFLGGETPTHDENVWQYLQSQEEYSKFVALAIETGVDTILNGTALLTVWAPVDSLMPESVETMEPDMKKMLVENHISLTTIFSRNLSRLSTVAAISGKYHNVKVTDSTCTVDGNNLLDMDQLFQNGVVHKSEGWMVPKYNMKQWLESLGDDYSIFRDSLNSLSQITFDKDNSPILGVDSTGMIIYDSVFTSKNSVISNANLANESARFTFFVPTNEAFERAISDKLEYFTEINRSDTLSAEDSTLMTRWMLSASMFRGLQSFDKTAETSLKSAGGKEIRQQYFNVIDSMEFSNGRVFILDTFYIPRNIFYSRVDFNPYYIRKFVGNFSTKESAYDKYWNTLNVTTSKVDNNSLYAFFQFNTAGPDNYYQFQTVEYDSETKVCTALPVLPGHYRVLFQFQTNDGNKTDQLDVYRVFTDSTQFIGSATGILKNLYYTSAANGKNGILCEDFDFVGNCEPVTFKVVVPGSQTTGPNRRIIIGACALVPQDNY